MNNLTDTNKLVIKNYPILSWMGGTFLLLLCGLALFFNFWTNQAAIIFACVAVFLFMWDPIFIITADKSWGLFTIRKQRLLWSIFVKEFPLRDIASIEIDTKMARHSVKEGPHVDSCEVIVMVLGEKEPLRNYTRWGLWLNKKKMKKMREFLGMAEIPPFGFPDGGNLFGVSPFTLLRDGAADGISWRLETASLTSYPLTRYGTDYFSGVTTTRWVSKDIRFTDHFLCLFQKPKDSKSLFGDGGTMGAITNSLDALAFGKGHPIFQRLLRRYGLPLEALSELESVKYLAELEACLASDFTALTNVIKSPSIQSGYLKVRSDAADPVWAVQILKPGVVTPLAAWSERNPLKQIQPDGHGQHGSLAVLMSPQGLFLSLVMPDNPNQVDNLVDLGIEIARAGK